MSLAQRLQLFPHSVSLQQGQLYLGGLSLTALAEQFGTPLYVYDQAEMESAVSAYRSALQAFWPGEMRLTYAAKAYLDTHMAQWAASQNLWVDCAGQTELRLAAHAGLERPQILAHGVNKSRADLETALQLAGTLVIDNLAELEHLAALNPISLPDLWLRLQPGLAVETHVYTQTGQPGSKFGMSAAEILQASQFCQRKKWPLKGLHFHQGSQFHDPAPLAPAIEAALNLATQMPLPAEWHFCPGGGWGVAYHEDDLPQPEVKSYVEYLARQTLAGLQKRSLPRPILQLEPGRSLVARAGVALYRVGTVKHSGGRAWALVDGGLADNPRPALYAARYSCLCANRAEAAWAGTYALGGPYCESGDVLIEAVDLPEVQEGDILAIPVSGAYQLSMGSNYNGALRPAVVWLQNGQARLAQRRQPIEALWERDIV